MRGIPAILNIPSAVRQDQVLSVEIDMAAQLAGIPLGSLESGFQSAAGASKGMERALHSMACRLSFDRMPPINTMSLKAMSGILSAEASSSESRAFYSEAWSQVKEAPPSFFEQVDALFTPRGGWRARPYAFILYGAPTNKDG